MIEMTENLRVLRFLCARQKGAAALLAVAPLITQLQKHAGCQEWGKPVYLDGGNCIDVMGSTARSYFLSDSST